uniref:CBM21 domain-containing protein n=1 Tax=Leptobrachium leishanense TaxID=445787 RepID=A0A8C5MC73_9ANUR
MSAASSCPAPLRCTSESPMENFDENNLNQLQLLDAPNTGDSCADEEDEKATLKPRFSPLPRRRSSVSSDDGEMEPPTSVARKVSFADAFGFDLVSVKEFDTWEVPVVSQMFEMESVKVEEFFLQPSFVLPSADVMMENLYVNKVLLESVDFIPGSSCMKGIIRVLNVSFEKQIYVRMSLDGWQSYYDLLGEYVPDSCTGDTDQFFFNISLVPPYQKEGAKVEFCICYETAIGKFWDSNDGLNYILTCHKKENILETENLEKVSEDLADRLKKSCLKPATSKEDEIEDLDVYERKNFRDTEISIPRIICSHEDDTEDNENEEADNSGEQDNGEQNEMDLFPSQCYLKTIITSSEDENDTEDSAQPSFPYGEDIKEPMAFFKDDSSGTGPQHQNEQLTEEQPTQESEILDMIELSPTMKDAFHLQEAGEPSSTAVADYKNLEVLPQEYVRKVKNEESITCTLSEQNFEQSQEDTSVEPDNEARKMVIISEKDESVNHGIYDETTEGTATAKMESIQSVRLLDDNANPSYSPDTINVSCVSETNNDNIDYEQGEISENREPDNSVTSISLSDSGSQLINKDEEIKLQSQELEHEFNSPAVTENITYSNKGSSLPDDLTSEAQLSNTSVETLFLSEDSEVTSGFKSLKSDLGKTYNVDWGAETCSSDFQTNTVTVAKQCHGSPSDDTSKYYVSQNVKTYLSYYDNNNSEQEPYFENSLLEEHDIDFISHETDKTSAYDKDESQVTDNVHKERSHTDVSNTLESNLSLETSESESHPSNLVSVSSSNTETLGEKVVIAVITEEENQSEIHSHCEDLSKDCYTHVCQSGDDWSTKHWDIDAGTELQVIDAKLEENISFGLGTNRELNKEETKSTESHIEVIDEKLAENISFGIVTNRELNKEETKSMESHIEVIDEKLAENINFGIVTNRELNKEETKSLELHIEEKTESDSNEMDQRTGLLELSHVHDVNQMHDDFGRDQNVYNTENVPESLTAQGLMDVRYTVLDDHSSSSGPDTSRIVAPISREVNDEEGSNGEAVESVGFSEAPLAENYTADLEEIIHIGYSRVEATCGPSIFISEPDDEVKTQSPEEQCSLEDSTQYHSVSHREAVPAQAIVPDDICTDPSSISHVSSKVLCFIMFVVFAGLMYHYDFLFCFALYLFSLYWLYWEGDKSKEPVRKE